MIERGRGRPAGTNPYKILGVVPDADPRELAHAYRRLLRRLHPDTRATHPDTHDVAAPHLERGPATDPSPSPEPDPEPDLEAVQHAYQLLRDPGRRARYDAQLAGEQRAGEQRGGARVVSRGRDTDQAQSGGPGPGAAEPEHRAAPGMPVSVPVRHHRPAPSEPWLLYVGPVRTHRPPRR